jgi:NTE family protein
VEISSKGIRRDSGLALVLSGGGARAAYQVGFMRYLATCCPTLSPGILTGVSAGGIVATHLAARPSTFANSVEALSDIWRGLRLEDVFRVDALDLGWRVTRWGLRLVSGGAPGTGSIRSFVDTSPLQELLIRTLLPDANGHIPGIAANLAAGALDAVALTASSYTTGQSVTWVERRPTDSDRTWLGPRGRSVNCRLRLNHVLASSSLPFFFPAAEVDGAWYGDGGIRLTAPLSPAVHLGAHRIIVVSTRFGRPFSEEDRPAVNRYPPPAQVAGVLFNAIFLDLLDADALRLQQVNQLVDRVPPAAREGFRKIDLLVLRPSQDLGQLANSYERTLPRSFRFLVRGLGSRDTRSNDLLSLLMFHPEYINRLMELGEADARARANEIEAFVQPTPSMATVEP